MTEKKLHISIEGNVACGKSTFLQGLENEIEKQQLSEIIEIFPEPLSAQNSEQEKQIYLAKCILTPHNSALLFNQ